MQKRQTPEKGFALFKNDITTFELALKYGIYSSNMQSGFVAGCWRYPNVLYESKISDP